VAILAWSYLRLQMFDEADYWIQRLDELISNPIQRFRSEFENLYGLQPL